MQDLYTGNLDFSGHHSSHFDFEDPYSTDGGRCSGVANKSPSLLIFHAKSSENASFLKAETGKTLGKMTQKSGTK